jgi:hypothetical protein
MQALLIFLLSFFSYAALLYLHLPFTSSFFESVIESEYNSKQSTNILSA